MSETLGYLDYVELEITNAGKISRFGADSGETCCSRNGRKYRLECIKFRMARIILYNKEVAYDHRINLDFEEYYKWYAENEYKRVLKK